MMGKENGKECNILVASREKCQEFDSFFHHDQAPSVRSTQGDGYEAIPCGRLD